MRCFGDFFEKYIDVDVFDDVFQNPKHRANDVNRPPLAGAGASQICGGNNEHYNDEDYDCHEIGEDENDDERLNMAVIMNTAMVMMTWMVVWAGAKQYRSPGAEQPTQVRVHS